MVIMIWVVRVHTKLARLGYSMGCSSVGSHKTVFTKCE